MTADGGWRIFARSIASSFLFLVGFSLYLAHARGIKWQSFRTRLVMVAGAALAITLVTYFATPDAYIFFGILHHIALASVLGLLFLRLPAGLVLAAAIAVIVLPILWRSQFFELPGLGWVGLAPTRPRSNDYVPVFPWFAAVLFGIAAARIAEACGWLDRAASIRLPSWKRPLIAIGRHSLAFYLLHQPILIALVFAFSMIVPAPTQDPVAGFSAACQEQCLAVRGEAYCRIYCDCVLGTIRSEDRVADIMSGAEDAETVAWLGDVAAQCTMRSDAETGGGFDDSE
jgi:uncharacterized membrane protein